MCAPGLPKPDSASAASLTSGSSIDTTLVARPFLSSRLMTLADSSGLAILTSAPRSLSECPRSIRGRLRADCGDGGCRGVDRRSKSGESTVLRSGKVKSCVWGLISCLGTAGHSTSSSDRATALRGVGCWASMLAHWHDQSAVVDVKAARIVFGGRLRHEIIRGGSGSKNADGTKGQSVLRVEVQGSAAQRAASQTQARTGLCPLNGRPVTATASFQSHAPTHRG